jgi:hypothetical protein
MLACAVVVTAGIGWGIKKICMEEDIVPPEHSYELPPRPTMSMHKEPSGNSKAASWLQSTTDCTVPAHARDTLNSMQRIPYSPGPSPTESAAVHAHGHAHSAESEAVINEAIIMSHPSQQSLQCPGQNVTSPCIRATSSAPTLAATVLGQREDGKLQRTSGSPGSVAPTASAHSGMIVRHVLLLSSLVV